jgi:hypothetical protein
MFIDCRMVVVYGVGDQNIWNTIPTKNKLNNRTKALNRSKRNRVNKSWTIKLAIDDTGTVWLSFFQKGWIIIAQYLQGLIIFVITELAIATLFCSCVSSWGIRYRAAEFYVFQQAHLGPSDPTAPFVASCLTSRAVSVEFHNCNDSFTRVAGRLWVPTMHSRDKPASCQRRIILVNSA